MTSNNIDIEDRTRRLKVKAMRDIRMGHHLWRLFQRGYSSNIIVWVGIGFDLKTIWKWLRCTMNQMYAQSHLVALERMNLSSHKKNSYNYLILFVYID